MVELRAAETTRITIITTFWLRSGTIVGTGDYRFMSQITAADRTIWRYLEVPAFLWMLARKKLHFTPAKAFLNDDPYEGFCHVVQQPNALQEYRKKRGIPDDVKTFTIDDPSESVALMFGHMRHAAATAITEAPAAVYVNSWCLGTESMAMWQEYGDRGRGVAVTSTIAQYESAVSFEGTRDLYKSKSVTYHDDETSLPRVDFSEGPVPLGGGLNQAVLEAVFHKRACFDHEREWRAAVLTLVPHEAGIDLPVDLEKLVTAVYVGPRAKPFVQEAVAAAMEGFRLQKPVQPSGLLRRPVLSNQPVGG